MRLLEENITVYIYVYMYIYRERERGREDVAYSRPGSTGEKESKSTVLVAEEPSRSTPSEGIRSQMASSLILHM